MDATDAYFESALEEYNQKVNELEEGGDPARLLDAYVNRGCILYMMEYRTSAMEDLVSAAEISDYLESEGERVDDGTFVKIHSTIASILFDQEGDTVEEYALAATRVGGLSDGSRHFDRRSIVRMCIVACKNLIDSECPEGCAPYLEKGLSLVGSRDQWSENRRMELLNLSAESAEESGDPRRAVELYAQAIELGLSLLERGSMEDPEEVLASFISKADAEADMGLLDMYIADMGAAVTLMEEMLACHRLDDKEFLVSLHHDLAGALMKQGRIQEAEKHLVRSMEISVKGASDFINLHTNMNQRPGGE